MLFKKWPLITAVCFFFFLTSCDKPEKETSAPSTPSSADETPLKKEVSALKTEWAEMENKMKQMAARFKEEGGEISEAEMMGNVEQMTAELTKKTEMPEAYVKTMLFLSSAAATDDFGRKDLAEKALNYALEEFKKLPEEQKGIILGTLVIPVTTMKFGTERCLEWLKQTGWKGSDDSGWDFNFYLGVAASVLTKMDHRSEALTVIDWIKDPHDKAFAIQAVVLVLVEEGKKAEAIEVIDRFIPYAVAIEDVGTKCSVFCIIIDSTLLAGGKERAVEIMQIWRDSEKEEDHDKLLALKNNAWRQIAEAFVKAGESERALEILEKIIDVKPSETFLLKKIEEIRTEAKKQLSENKVETR